MAGSVGRIAASFRASVGDVVFGMEDGTVSIFGLVFGLAASAQSSEQVLLAGATGAAAAAVSMMAGTYLDVESARDGRLAAAARLETLARDDPAALASSLHAKLTSLGTPAGAADAIVGAAGKEGSVALAMALESGAGAETQGPLGHALWMFVADLIAGAVPVLPFAFLPLDEARWVSLGITTVLLVLLGIGRGLVGKRNMPRSVLETVTIAAAAALGGLAIGQVLTAVA